MGIDIYTVSLKELIRERGMTIADLSRESGVAYGTLYDLVRGRSSPQKVNAETSLAIAHALDVSMEELLGIDRPNRNHLAVDEIALLDMYRQGDKPQKAAILASAEGIIGSFRPRYEYVATESGKSPSGWHGCF